MKNKNKNSLFVQGASNHYQTVHKQKELQKRRKKKRAKKKIKRLVKKYFFRFLFKGIEIIWGAIQLIQVLTNLFKDR